MVDSPRLERLLLENAGFVARFVRKLGVEAADLDDVTQRVFLVASRKLDQMPRDKERSYLCAIALREASHERRTYRRRREVPEWNCLPSLVTYVGPDELLQRRQAQERAQAVLARLADELRSVFVLFEHDGHTAREIGERLELPVGTVKTRLRRARSLVAQGLDDVAAEQ